jgi:hypothetical protein
MRRERRRLEQHRHVEAAGLKPVGDLGAVGIGVEDVEQRELDARKGGRRRSDRRPSHRGHAPADDADGDADAKQPGPPPAPQRDDAPEDEGRSSRMDLKIGQQRLPPHAPAH